MTRFGYDSARNRGKLEALAESLSLPACVCCVPGTARILKDAPRRAKLLRQRQVIQQAIAQVFQAIWDPTFSDSSFGFRPGRSQHDALKRAKTYVQDGYRHIVDMDLAKFFDTINRDRLMSRLTTRVHDKRVLKLVRRFLTAGIMIGGLVSPSVEGTPQGGPLSPPDV